MSETPDRFYMDREDRKLYDQLANEEVFNEKTRKEQFLFAAAIGFKNKVRRPLETKEGLFLIKDIRLEDETLINAIALKETKSVQVLADREEVFRIVEEYAHAGIRLLIDKIKSTQFGPFDKHLEKELFEIYESLGFGGEYEENTSS